MICDGSMRVAVKFGRVGWVGLSHFAGDWARDGGDGELVRIILESSRVEWLVRFCRFVWLWWLMSEYSVRALVWDLRPVSEVRDVPDAEMAVMCEWLLSILFCV